MRELLQENLTEALGAMTAAFTMSLTAHTQQLTSTLTDLGTRINEHQSTLSNLQLEVGQHSTGLNESIAAIVQLNKDLKERATAAPTLQENVIPHEPPQPAASTSSNRPATPVDPDVTEPPDNAGDATRVDVTANSALAHLVRDDSQTGRANAAWRNAPLLEATPTVTTSRPPPAPPRTRPGPQFGLGNPVSTLVQTHLTDHLPPRPTMIDTSPTDDEPIIWHGGMITSPRYIDRRKQILARNIHPTDIAALADTEYHGGMNGRTTIDMQFVHSCGYGSSISDTDVVTAYGEIILLHTSTMERWENVRTQQHGPQLERIIEKGLASLPRLPGFSMEEIIDFYDKLQPVSTLYLLPIIPFDCINITMGYEALCPPGLGKRRYATIGRVLLEVLPRILPKLHSQVNTIITMVRQESNNGYDLLWRILELGVPGFDPSVPIRVPIWRDDDIFDFANAFCLYYRLLAKKGMLYDDRARSVTFLQAITAPAYVDAANTILINVHNYFGSGYDTTLPPALCIMGIANQLHEQSVKRAAAIVPRARRLAYDDVVDKPPDPHQAYRMDGNRRWNDRPANNDRPQHGRVDNRYDRQDRIGDGNIGRYGRGGPPRPVVQGSRGPTRDSASRGRYVRPDRNRGAYLPDTICDACRRPGHVAATCDVLAMALFIEKYKRDISGDLKDKIERDWVTRWKDTVGSNRPPRRVMKTYVDHLDISVDDLDDLLCWDCWPDDDTHADDVEDGLADSA